MVLSVLQSHTRKKMRARNKRGRFLKGRTHKCRLCPRFTTRMKNKLCCTCYERLWCRRHPWVGRRYRLKYRFNLTEEGFEKLMVEQKGGCAICGRTPKQQRGKRLSIDHDHKTNCRRGLLCYRCNMFLGHVKDNIEILESAIRYLCKYADLTPENKMTTKNDFGRNKNRANPCLEKK